MPTPLVRQPTDAEWAELPAFSAHAFLDDPEPEKTGSTLDLLERDRTRAVVDERDRMIGTGGILTRTITLPGAGPSPVAAITFVGVRPDSRGRGALTALMRDLLDRGAEPIAALWASMAPIYGRYGFGLASRSATLTVPGRAPFRPGAPEGGSVRWYPADSAFDPMREVFDGLLADRVGWVSRTETTWRRWFRESRRERDGSTDYRYALHHAAGDDRPDGYAVFRCRSSWPAQGPDYQLDIRELVSANPAAHAGLWRGLLDLDFTGRVRHSNVPLDDPLPLLLANPRGVLTDVSDQLWVRLIDLSRALPARRYAAPCELVLEVADRFCPWNAGRWWLRVDEHGHAETARADRPADLECDTTDLASAFLGGTRLAALATAGRVRELTPGAVRALSRAMAGDIDPHCSDVF